MLLSEIRAGTYIRRVDTVGEQQLTNEGSNLYYVRRVCEDGWALLHRQGASYDTYYWIESVLVAFDTLTAHKEMHRALRLGTSSTATEQLIKER